MKKISLILAGVLAGLLLAGCGGSGETDASTETVARREGPPPVPPVIRVSLNGYMGPENVGVLVADNQGFFKDVGLDVWLGAPNKLRSPIPYVANRLNEFGVAQLPQVAMARENGVPVVAVGSVIPRPTAAMIWLEGSGIRTLADLRGKTIAVPGIPFQEELLRFALGRAGLTLDDVQIDIAGYNLLPALVSGRADAVFGGSSNIEGAALEARRAKPVIKPVQSMGVPPYDELVVVARSDRVAANPGLIRRFVAAVMRGSAVAIRNPRAAARAIEASAEVNPLSSFEELEAQLKATLPLLSRSGHMDPTQAADLVRWMREQGWIEQPMPVSELLTNEYLPQP